MIDDIVKRRSETLFDALTDAFSPNGVLVTSKSQIEQEEGSNSVLSVKKDETLICEVTVSESSYEISSGMASASEDIGYSAIEKDGKLFFCVDSYEECLDIVDELTKLAPSKDHADLQSAIPVEELRTYATDWFKKQDARIEVFGRGKQRQTMLSPVLDRLVPQTYLRKKGRIHYALYEVEIRPNHAVVRMMCTQDKDIPDSVKEVYIKCFLPLMSKTYREDGQYYNTTFASMIIKETTTRKEFEEMLEKAWTNIQKFESELLMKYDADK